MENDDKIRPKMFKVFLLLFLIMMVKGSIDIWPEVVTAFYYNAAKEGIQAVTQNIIKTYLIVSAAFTAFVFIASLGLSYGRANKSNLLMRSIGVGLITPMIIPGFGAFAWNNPGVFTVFALTAFAIYVYLLLFSLFS
jgi:hypothetical protein